MKSKISSDFDYSDSSFEQINSLFVEPVVSSVVPSNRSIRPVASASVSSSTSSTSSAASTTTRSSYGTVIASMGTVATVLAVRSAPVRMTLVPGSAFACAVSAACPVGPSLARFALPSGSTYAAGIEGGNTYSYLNRSVPAEHSRFVSSHSHSSSYTPLGASIHCASRSSITCMGSVPGRGATRLPKSGFTRGE